MFEVREEKVDGCLTGSPLRPIVTTHAWKVQGSGFRSEAAARI